MAYVMIEGYLCERCGYRWSSRNGTGYRDQRDPGHCPKCKTPYWNRPRKNNLPEEKQALRWSERGRPIPEVSEVA